MTHDFDMPQKPTKFNEAAGERLKLLQTALGLKQGQFAKLLGMSSSGLANCQAGDNAPKPYKLLVLKEEHGVTLDYIYTGDRKGLRKELADELAKLVVIDASPAKPKAKRRAA